MKFQGLSVQQEDRASIPIGFGVLIQVQFLNEGLGRILKRPGVEVDFGVATVVPVANGAVRPRLRLRDEGARTGFFLLHVAVFQFRRKLKWRSDQGPTAATGRYRRSREPNPGQPARSQYTSIFWSPDIFRKLGAGVSFEIWHPVPFNANSSVHPRQRAPVLYTLFPDGTYSQKHCVFHDCPNVNAGRYIPGAALKSVGAADRHRPGKGPDTSSSP